MMKRLVTILGILILVGAMAVPVLAYGPGWGRGRHMMGDWGGGPGYCRDYGRGDTNLSEEQRTQLDTLSQKYYGETSKLRNEIWTKRTELSLLLNAPNPDVEKARALQKEISDLKAQMDEKRLNFRLDARKINPDTPYGRGYGMGYGRQRGGNGPGSCRN